jgi:hypothetical protein
MAFNFFKTILNKNKSYTNSRSVERIGEPYDFQRNVHVKIDMETGGLVGLPLDWEEIFKKNGIETTMDVNKLTPIFKAYERSLRDNEKKGLS